MPLDKIPGLGQFEWITSPMGFTLMPSKFSKINGNGSLHRKNFIVYIDDLLIHSQTIGTFGKTFKGLRSAGMKIILKNVLFGNMF